jgi:hypothetical protein
MFKVIAVIGFIILGIVIDCGGAPKGGYIGAHYWHDPGAFTNFNGFCSVFVTAAFAFSGTEMSGLAAAEAKKSSKGHPQSNEIGILAYHDILCPGNLHRWGDCVCKCRMASRSIWCQYQGFAICPLNPECWDFCIAACHKRNHHHLSH